MSCVFTFPKDLPAESGMCVSLVRAPATPQERAWAAQAVSIWRVCLWENGRMWFRNVRGPRPNLDRQLMDLACAPRAWVEIVRPAKVS